MKHIVYIITDLGNILVIENEISSLMITWLCILKNMQLITLIMNLSYNNFKI